MKLFAIIRDVSGDYGVSYDGMTESTVIGLLNQRGLPFDLVSEDQYNILVNASQPHPVPPPDLSNEKIIAKNKSAKVEDRLDAVIKILGL